MQEKEALIDVFDEDRKNIGHKFRNEVNKRLDILKQVNIIILDDKKRIYVTKAKNGWGTSAAGLVRHDEALADAAKRTLKRELGLTMELKATQENYYNFEGVRRLLSVHHGTTKTEPKPNPEDVEEGKWVTTEEAEQMIKNDECMPTFAVALEVMK